MIGLAEVRGRDLVWVQPHWARREHELRAGDDLVAKMVAQGWLTPTRFVELARGRWRIRRQGWFPPLHVLMDAGGAIRARMRNKWLTGAVLILDDERHWTWRPISLIQREWGFFDDAGETWVRLRHGGVFRVRAHVSIDRPREPEEILLMMAILGFQALLHRRHASAH